MKKLPSKICLHVNDQIRKELEEIAEKYGLSASATLRQAIKRWHLQEFPQKADRRGAAVPDRA